MHSIQPVPPRSGTEPRVLQATVRSPFTGGPAGKQDDDEPLIDIRLVSDFTRFLLNACKRRKGILALVFVAFVGAGVAASFLLPKKYYSETKLLADRNVVMPLLGNPDRRLPNEADTPTRMASELIMTRDNLVGIIRATDLVKQTDARRPLLGRLKQRVREMVQGPQTPEEKTNDIIWSLRTNMNVQVGDGTVIIGVVWNDPNLAFRIVQAAQQSFLEERQAQEVSLITGSIAILEKSAAEVGGDIKRMLDSLGKQRAALAPDDARMLAMPSATSAAPRSVSSALLTAQSNLESTVRAIADIEGFRTRRLNELQATLAEQRITFGAEHPQIENTQQLIKSLATDSPQLLQLRQEEKRLRDQVVALGGSPAEVEAVAANADQSFAALAMRNIAGMRMDSILQEKQQYGQTRLRIAMTQYQALLERLESARIELETVSATFRFKYGVLIPASVANSPITLSPVLIVVTSLVLGVLMAIGTVVVLDFAGRRVLEPWQIERTIGLPVLGEAPLALPSK